MGDTDAHDRWMLIVRAVVGQIQKYTSAIAIYCLPLATATIVINMYPLIIPILAFLMLKEEIKCIEVVALCLCFAGIIMVNIAGKSSDVDDEDFGKWMRFVGIGAAFTTAVGISGLSVLTRKLKKIHFTVVGLWYNGFGIIVFGLAYFINSLIAEGFFTIFPTRMYVLALIGGLCNVSGQMCQIKALQVQPASRAGIIANTQVIWAFIFDITYFGTAFGMVEFGGSFLIFAVVTGVAIMNFMAGDKKK